MPAPDPDAVQPAPIDAPLPPPAPGRGAPATSDDPPAPVDPARSRWERRRLGLLVGSWGALVVLANIGTVLSPRLVNSNPPLLLLLSARNRHLLLTVAADIDPVAYVVTAAPRLALAAVICFFLGRFHGAAALEWIERQTQGELPATFRWIERGVDRAGGALLVLMPGSNVVCTLVGMRGMAVRRFAVLLAAGIVVRLASFWVLGKAFEEPLDKVLDVIERYQWWLVGAFFVVTLITSARRSTRIQPPRAPDG
jgi:membrane protein DedA with SNARE-associated domain